MNGEAGQTFWACAVPEKRMFPGERLDAAISLARDRMGRESAGEIYVHAETAAETPARVGLELVARAGVGRFDYWFPRENQEGPT